MCLCYKELIVQPCSSVRMQCAPDPERDPVVQADVCREVMIVGKPILRSCWAGMPAEHSEPVHAPQVALAPAWQEHARRAWALRRLGALPS
jgi:hypothetical protein